LIQNIHREQTIYLVYLFRPLVFVHLVFLLLSIIIQNYPYDSIRLLTTLYDLVQNQVFFYMQLEVDNKKVVGFRIF